MSIKDFCKHVINPERAWQHVIVAAACKYGDVIIVGARHYDLVMHSQLSAFSDDSEVKLLNRGEVVQGFIDNKGKFHDREQALVIAKAANQIKFKTQPEDELFSEDLY